MMTVGEDEEIRVAKALFLLKWLQYFLSILGTDFQVEVNEIKLELLLENYKVEASYE